MAPGHTLDELWALASEGKSWAMREAMWRTHHGTCQRCGLDTTTLGRLDQDTLRARGFIPGRHRHWEVDHIVPIALGGDHTKDNLRVLCRPCHREATLEQFGRRRGRGSTAKAVRVATPIYRALLERQVRLQEARGTFVSLSAVVAALLAQKAPKGRGRAA